jgi:hypothetical protein
MVSGFNDVDEDGFPFTATHVDKPGGDELLSDMISGSGSGPGSTKPPLVSLSIEIM